MTLLVLLSAPFDLEKEKEQKTLQYNDILCTLFPHQRVIVVDFVANIFDEVGDR